MAPVDAVATGPAPASVPARRAAGLIGALLRTRWAVADQTLISATNFVTMVLVARAATPSEFGLFAMVYMVLLLANTVQSGLITQPHNILGTTRSGDDYRRYTTGTAWGQAALMAAAAAAAALAWGVALFAGWGAAPLLLALVPAILAWQAQEFLRRILYTEGRLGGALLNDLISYGLQAVGVVALWRLGALTGPRALYALAATSSLAAAVAAVQLRRSFARRGDSTALRANWEFGKWLVGSELVGVWLSSQVFVFVAAALLGASAAGVLRAVHTVFGALRILSYVFESLLPIRFARVLASGGRAALRSEVRHAYALAAPLLGGGCLALVVGSRPLLGLIFGEKYLAYAPLLALSGVTQFLGYATMIGVAAVRAERLTRVEFRSRIRAAVVATPVGCLLVYALGVYGAVLGGLFNAIVMIACLWRTYWRSDRVGVEGEGLASAGGAGHGTDRE